jgi:hypothetical protein
MAVHYGYRLMHLTKIVSSKMVHYRFYGFGVFTGMTGKTLKLYGTKLGETIHYGLLFN